MNMKRMRGRHNRSGGSSGGSVRHNNGQIPLNRNHVFDSNGPDLRVRGTAQQLFEKYLQLGRDASSTGDRVMAEAYFQHAEHYFRILNAMTQAAQQSQLERQERMNGRQQRPLHDNRQPVDSGAEDTGEQPALSATAAVPEEVAPQPSVAAVPEPPPAPRAPRTARAPRRAKPPVEKKEELESSSS
ncbi:DUF4167 domain-containing protein [Komagataeibacter medellinensis]|uniref:DUF4167 domain-containing protein n=1 Tax=Komagataeibacter medellinensis TaxID=1177712 RepID=A0ABQ6VYD1_9PROT|nr:DUF4167 domain-containing protein [Komagataeibacter medellinensis]KAB8125086.1 DUF4167 domain-containing protein [Komagataeibacter medellinensis]